MSTALPGPASRSRVDPSTVFAGLILLGAAVAVCIGAYAKVHTPAGRPLFTLGFSGMLQMKAWLTTLALALLFVQLLTALWMWGKLPGAGGAPAWGVILHRWSGATAFVVTLPVAFHCIWALGWGVESTRVVVHGELGCAFYGAYAAKMLGLRVPRLPSWGLPVLGGLVLAFLVLVWATAALWFFTESGSPLT
ncbi:MAG: DUF6529 family protein [Frankiaceae bacterium]